jgi:hypothetical protein
MSESDVTRILTSLYHHSELGNYDLALDIIFEEFDRLFTIGQFVVVDLILEEVDLNRLDSHTRQGLLSASYVARERLPAREDLKLRVERRQKETA